VILVDTTPLVALCDPRDPLHARALRDLDRMARGALVLCSPVLTEACFLLPRIVQRERLRRILTELPIHPMVASDETSIWAEAFSWMRRYAEHGPDWADAYLAVVNGREKRSAVWTYDREFRTTWRRPDGRRIPLALGAGS